MHICSKEARNKDAAASDKLKAAKAGDQDAKRLEEEAAKLAERSRAAQEKAERTEKEAHNVRTGLTGLQGNSKSKRQAAERYALALAPVSVSLLQYFYSFALALCVDFMDIN